MGFFKKTKGLPALEKRLLDAVQKQESLKNAKEQLLADLLHAQDSGSDVTSINARLTDVRSDIELVEKEISLLKDDIREYCRLEAQKEVDALPARKAAFEAERQRLLDEGHECFARAVQIFAALGGEFTPEGLIPGKFKPGRDALSSGLMSYLNDRSYIASTDIPGASHDRFVDLLAGVEGRVGVRLRGAA